MIDLALRAVVDGEKHEMRTFATSDVVALERHSGKASLRSADIGFEDTCFLVWRWLRRNGHIGMDVAFDDAFLDRIDDIEQLTGAPAPLAEEPSEAP